MDLRSKLRNLVTKQDSVPTSLMPASSVETADDFVFNPTNTIQHLDSPSGPKSPSREHKPTDLRESIEGIFFQDELFDSSLWELQNLNGDFDLTKVDQRRKKLRMDLELVTRQLSKIILQKQVAYTEELKRVTEIEHTLGAAEEVCKTARRATQRSHSSFAARELRLLQFYNRGQSKLLLLQSLSDIIVHRKTIKRIKELLDDEDYPEAIRLILSARVALKQRTDVSCLSQLLESLQEILRDTESRLDDALSRISVNFDPVLYGRVYHAFQLLDKNQTAMDHLLMHFITTIHNRCFGIVLSFVELSFRKSGKSLDNLSRRPYQELCQGVSPEFFVPTLMTLAKGLWEVMRTYRSLVQWHQAAHESERHRLARGDSVAGTDAGSEVSSKEKEMVELYVIHKLESGAPRLWADMEQKLRALLIHKDSASHLKYDSFGQMLAVLRRFCVVGKQFGGQSSDALMEAVKQQAAKFFTTYHRSKLEELHFFIDNECWEVCPMKNGFSCFDLWEFQFLRTRSSEAAALTEDGGGDALSTSSSLLIDFQQDGSPFDEILKPEEHSEDVLLKTDGQAEESSESDEDAIEELKEDEVDETGELASKRPKLRRSSAVRSIMSGGPVVTNSTLTVLRLFGRYLFFMTMMESIAAEAVNSLTQYFEYYLFTVFSIFSVEIHDYFEPTVVSRRLRSGVTRIQENLISQNGDQIEFQPDGKVRIPPPSSRIDLTDPKSFFGLPERVAAVESLLFLASQMDKIRPHLDKALPAQRRVFLQQFYQQSVFLAADVRPVAYWNVVYRTLNYDKALTMMAAVQWDIKDLASQYSPYVDHLVKELEKMGRMIVSAKKYTALPKEAVDTLWTCAVLLANRTFVEGFSGVKKCTNEGRALMQLDYQQFVVKAEKITSLRPLPETKEGEAYVTSYIKAFYLPEDALEKWIREHKEYTLKHMTGLIEQAPSLGKKTKQRLIQYVEDPATRSRR